MSFDWQSAVKAIAPVLGGAFGGPLGAAASGALASALLGNKKTGDAAQDETNISNLLAKGITPEIRAKIIDAETQLKIATLDYADKASARELESEKVYVTDTQDARKYGNSDVFALGVVILGGFSLLMGGVLYALYQILTDGIKVSDPGTVAVVFTMLGTVVGYVASIAQQVCSFYYGSSKSSAQKSEQLSDAIRNLSGTKAGSLTANRK